MNSSSRVPARWKTPLAASALIFLSGLGLAFLARVAAAAGSVDSLPAVAADGGKKIDFAKDVAPIFKTSCVKCHSVDPAKPKKKAAGGFRLDDKAAALKGGRSGADILPGNAKDSLFFKLLSGPVTMPDKDDDDKEIPPMPKVKRGEKWKPLSDDQIATLKQWIDQGANWPD